MIPKQQHWVPRFYLSFFATPDTSLKEEPQVWLLGKDQCNGPRYLPPMSPRDLPASFSDSFRCRVMSAGRAG